ncbi:thioredoxin-disulfide reductase [Slackia exigua]|uniref:Thioredoxin reductase n=1 Tax=Slackia exigua (strain ATCC 700122 / DSM 15923 / CIP 105133 / JCM 11022 / KCTC 5966 / S-7) TaxID=649764 RepID=D0WFR6_SLAES|nr:thioredoxin-disulfide reductase [Slackia exigua]EEZ61329.1 thioredoxin-disulfide reductase [Slackia exigua ATCC 700122]MCQ5090612.1 thioredoxin-disulfide reductase [Slackia exigua]STN98976.1 Thioredoxin reductase [Slackia exigua]
MSEANRFNVAIIGQGPAGMTAALYAGRAGLSTVSFERMGPGGQMTTTDALDNYPGFAEGAEPFALSFAMSAQAARFGAQAKTDEVVGLDLASAPKRIVTASGEEYAADAVILAMGAAPRPLGIPHEDELRGKGISYCATCDGGFFKDKVAVVVGGGNTAVEDAMYLANICTEVHLVHRRDTLRADAIYAKPLDELKNVTKHMSAAVDGVREEDGRVAGVLIRDLATGEVTDLDASALFVAVGSLPKSDILRDTGIELDERGYVVAGEDGKTSIPGVFAAGDVRTKQLRQVATAVGDGANAAASAFEFLSFE